MAAAVHREFYRARLIRRRAHKPRDERREPIECVSLFFLPRSFLFIVRTMKRQVKPADRAVDREWQVF